MKKFFIKASVKGSIELLLFLPMAAVMLWGIGYLYFLLQQKSAVTRAAWVYGMSIAHQSDEPATKKRIQPFDVREHTYCNELVASPGPLARSFPIALSTYLAANCSKKMELSLKNPTQSNSSQVIVPGKNFKGDDTLKQLMWSEAMVKIKKEPIPLQSLGVPELLRALSGGISASVLGNEASTFLGEIGGLK